MNLLIKILKSDIERYKLEYLLYTKFFSKFDNGTYPNIDWKKLKSIQIYSNSNGTIGLGKQHGSHKG